MPAKRKRNWKKPLQTFNLHTHRHICLLLCFWHIGVMVIKHVISHHFFPHSAGPFCHLQHPFVQMGADGGAPQPSLPQQFILNLAPLFRHVLQGILLTLRGGSPGWFSSKSTSNNQKSTNNLKPS